MKMKDMLGKKEDDLRSDLLRLLREEFDFRVQRSINSSVVQKTHVMRNIRRKVAMIQMVLCHKKRSVIS
ncbi:MAG: 50S ribosomal subunit protein L29 [Candidatus Westeberhardia cardiocondylae]|nr:50S ribosomal subunit protein L29 [Candidatus Westeberhardia cardiocondylae]